MSRDCRALFIANIKNNTVSSPLTNKETVMLAKITHQFNSLHMIYANVIVSGSIKKDFLGRDAF